MMPTLQRLFNSAGTFVRRIGCKTASRTLAEISESARAARRGLDTPVRVATEDGLLRRICATDYFSSFSRMFRTAPTVS